MSPSDTFLLILGVTLAVIIMSVFLIQPFWSIFDCAIATHFAPKTKVLWLAGLLAFGIGAGFFYGTLATQSRRLKLFTKWGTLAMVLSIAIIAALTILLPPKSLSGAKTRAQAGTKTMRSVTAKPSGHS